MRNFSFNPKQRCRSEYIPVTVLNRLNKFAIRIILAITIMAFNPLQGCANQHMVGMDQNETTIKMKVNEILHIELPGNAGTGFEWRFKKWNDEFFILLGSHKKIFEKNNPGYVGNAYLKSWSVKAAKAGRSDIRLLYYRSWEGETMAENSFFIKVLIEP